MNTNYFSELCEKICEENMTYEEICSLCENEGIVLNRLLEFLKSFVEKRTKTEISVYNGIVKSKNLFLGFYNPILLEHGIYSYYLWENEHEHSIMAKFVYTFCCTIDKETGCKKIALKYNLPLDKLYELHDYYKKQLVEEETIPRPYYVSSRTDVYFDKLIEMLKTNDKKDFYKILVNIIKDNNFTKKQVSESLLGYLTKNKIGMRHYDSFRKIIDTCFEYIKKEKKEKESNNKDLLELEASRNIINSFINSELCLEDYCEVNFITNKKMNKAVTVIKENDIELYNLYINVYEARKAIRDEIIKGELLKLYNYLVNGIEVNNIKRDFTIIDYYKFINLDFRKLVTYFKLIDDEEIRCTINRFKNENIKYIYSVNAIAKRMMDTDFSIKTNDGILVPITLEERIMVVEYIKSIGVPINEYTIYCAYTLYVNKTLFELRDMELSLSC